MTKLDGLKAPHPFVSANQPRAKLEMWDAGPEESRLFAFTYTTHSAHTSQYVIRKKKRRKQRVGLACSTLMTRVEGLEARRTEPHTHGSI